MSNVSYMTALEAVVLLSPLLLYPYLTRVLGPNAYGWVITAQVFVSYFTKFVDYGFTSVSARWVSTYRSHNDVLGRILGTILFFRLLLWIFSFIVLLVMVYLLPKCQHHRSLFIVAYMLTFEILLYPRFFFQGIEKMKYVSFIGIGARLLAIISIFLFVNTPRDGYIVLLSNGLAYLLSGFISLWIIYNVERVNFFQFNLRTLRLLLREARFSFFTDAVTLIKDKFNYFIVGASLGMEMVVVYDLGLKFLNLLSKPGTIITAVLYPRMALHHDRTRFWRGAAVIFLVTLSPLLLVLFLLPWLANFFLPGITNLFEVGLFASFSVVLCFTCYFYYCSMMAFGKVKQIFYTLLVTTSAYLIFLALFYSLGLLTNLLWVVMLAGICYFVEFIYSGLYTLRNIPLRLEYLKRV